MGIIHPCAALSQQKGKQMQFATTLNYTVVTVKYDEQDAADMEGAVNQIEVLWNGMDIVEVMNDDDHTTLIQEAEEHFENFCIEERAVV
jgi:hypothetical protein